jgi:hypothetical protein
LLDHICILGHDTAFESLAPVFERLLDLVRTKQSSLLTMDRFRMVSQSISPYVKMGDIRIGVGECAGWLEKDANLYEFDTTRVKCQHILDSKMILVI